MMKMPLIALSNRFQHVSAIAASATFAISAIAFGSLPLQAQAQAPTAASVNLSTLADGVYLYGQSTEPEEIGKEYFVFEAKAGKVIGALYMPHSSFDCAEGSFSEDQLALTVTNSYDRTTNPFEIALDKTSTVASSSGAGKNEIGLLGFHRLNTVSENDQRILNVCKADLQK